ncbi:MAG: Stress response kinase A [Gammaproteobacteria bacterium]|nr:Stress response kinase A [Gammaproteobacteria bacterium]
MDEEGPGLRAPYTGLTPECILDAVEMFHLRCDGRLLALNSYENRVYQVGIEEAPPVIAKFYRPGRWTDAAILEEHRYTQQLAEIEIPAVPPIADECGRTLHRHAGYRFSIYPRKGGRAPELGDGETLTWLGRFIGRMHAVGRAAGFEHRPTLSIEAYGERPSRFVIDKGFVPPDLLAAYRSTVDDVLQAVRAGYQRAGDIALLRLHGDCHMGNVLWTDAGPHFVDFDDCMMGPAVQDLWMLLSGSRDDMIAQLASVLDGYEEFAEFDYSELQLIEPLRSLRMIHYAGWLARRWDDPAFPMHFPWFNTQRYWQDHVLSLREQLAAMSEPALNVLGTR